MMVGRKVNFSVEKPEIKKGAIIMSVKNLSVKGKDGGKNVVNNVSFDTFSGEILCIAGIDGNGQTEIIQSITGLRSCDEGKVILNGKNVSKESIRYRNTHGVSHIPEDRHKHGLILDYSLEENLVLKKYFTKDFQNKGFLKFDKIHSYSQMLTDNYDIRTGQGIKTTVRSMSGGNQQKAIIAREIDLDQDLLIAVQPTRGLDAGAIEYIHTQLVAQRNKGKAVLLVSLELDEVMNVSDRILVIYEGEIVANLNPKETSIQEIGLYMSGSKRSEG